MQLNVNISRELYMKLKIKCLQKKIMIKDAIYEAIKLWLEKN